MTWVLLFLLGATRFELIRLGQGTVLLNPAPASMALAHADVSASDLTTLFLNPTPLAEGQGLHFGLYSLAENTREVWLTLLYDPFNTVIGEMPFAVSTHAALAPAGGFLAWRGGDRGVALLYARGQDFSYRSHRVLRSDAYTVVEEHLEEAQGSASLWGVRLAFRKKALSFGLGMDFFRGEWNRYHLDREGGQVQEEFQEFPSTWNVLGTAAVTYRFGYRGRVSLGYRRGLRERGQTAGPLRWESLQEKALLFLGFTLTPVSKLPSQLFGAFYRRGDGGFYGGVGFAHTFLEVTTFRFGAGLERVLPETGREVWIPLYAFGVSHRFLRFRADLGMDLRPLAYTEPPYRVRESQVLVSFGLSGRI